MNKTVVYGRSYDLIYVETTANGQSVFEEEFGCFSPKLVYLHLSDGSVLTCEFGPEDDKFVCWRIGVHSLSEGATCRLERYSEEPGYDEVRAIVETAQPITGAFISKSATGPTTAELEQFWEQLQDEQQIPYTVLKELFNHFRAPWRLPRKGG